MLGDGGHGAALLGVVVNRADADLRYVGNDDAVFLVGEQDFGCVCAQIRRNELLQLGQGSVIELNKLAGEPLEIYVSGKLVARGEAAVINEKFGVRLTDIISPIERVKQLA